MVKEFERLSQDKKRGCPTCDGIDPKTCMRCSGKTRMCDWINTPYGWEYVPERNKQ